MPEGGEPKGAGAVATPFLAGDVVVGRRVLRFSAELGAVVATQAPRPPRFRRRPRDSDSALAASAPLLLGREEALVAARAALEILLPVQFVGEAGAGTSTLLASLGANVPLPADGVIRLSVRGLPVRDLFQRLFDATYECDVAVVLTDRQLNGFMQRLAALVLLDDVDLPPADIQMLADSIPRCLIALASEEELLGAEGRTVRVCGLPEGAGMALVERQLGRELTDEERPHAMALWEAFGGLPLQLIQAVALVREDERLIEDVVELARSGSPANALSKAAVGALRERERRVLGVLACLGGIPAGTEFVAAVTGLAGTVGALNLLVRRGLVHSDGTQYWVAGPGIEAVRRAVEADWWSERIVEHLAGWAEDHRDGHRSMVEAAGVLLWAIDRAETTGRWPMVLRLAQATEAAFGLGALWSTWEKVLKAGLDAARLLSDREAEASFLHQMGTRALCTGDAPAAECYLAAALDIRRSLPAERPVAATTDNLKLLQADRSSYRSFRRPSAFRPPRRGPRRRSGLLLAAKIALIISLIATPVGLFLIRDVPHDYVSLTSETFVFGRQPVGTVRQHDAVLTNRGHEAVSFDHFRLTPPLADFEVDDHLCTAPPLAPGKSCSVSVTFRPKTTGPTHAVLAVTEVVSGKRLSVEVSGIGTPPGSGPAVSFDQQSLALGRVAVGQTRKATVRVSNTGTDRLRILRVSFAPHLNDFGLVTNCLSDRSAPREPPANEVLPGKSCTVTVVFNPRAVGPRPSNLVVEDDAVRSRRQTIPLIGTGVGPATGAAVSLQPATLGFRTVSVGQSASATVTLRNVGPGYLAISGILFSGSHRGDFDGGSSCPLNNVRLGPGKTCTITVTFDPVTPGRKFATLTIIDKGVGSPQTVPLSGTAVAPPQLPNIRVYPVAVDFGSRPVGQIAAARTVKLTNVGQRVLDISSIGLRQTGSDFAIAAGCPQKLSGGATCTVNVTFSPSSPGSTSAMLSITSSGSQGVELVPIQGAGLPTAGVASVYPAALALGDTPIGSTSEQIVTVTNSGAGPLSILGSSIDPASAFTIDTSAPGCAGAELGPHLSCQILVEFRPTVEGPVSTILTVSTGSAGAAGQTNTVALSGSGVAPPVPAAVLSASVLDFGAVPVQRVSQRALTVTNGGPAGSTLVIDSNGVSMINAAGEAFSVDPASNCAGATLQAGQSCEVLIDFSPSITGSVRASLVLADNAPDPQQSVFLLGSGA